MAESVLYEDRGTRISTHHAVFPTATYRIAAIQAVGKQTLPEQAGWALLACGLPGLIFLIGAGAARWTGENELRVVALLVLALPLLGLAAGGGWRLMRAPSARYVLTVSTGGKSEAVLVSTNEDLIDEARAALEQAMAPPGGAVETRYRDLGDRSRHP
jgi:hypothetical protein